MDIYVWDLVDAATALPRPAVPLAAGLLAAADDGFMDAEARHKVLALLAHLGDVTPSPAQAAMVDAWRATRAPGSTAGTATSTPAWQVIRMLQMEGHADAALTFMHELASAQVRRVAREAAACDIKVAAASAEVHRVERELAAGSK